MKEPAPRPHGGTHAPLLRAQCSAAGDPRMTYVVDDVPKQPDLIKGREHECAAAELGLPVVTPDHALHVYVYVYVDERRCFLSCHPQRRSVSASALTISRPPDESSASLRRGRPWPCSTGAIVSGARSWSGASAPQAPAPAPAPAPAEAATSATIHARVGSCLPCPSICSPRTRIPSGRPAVIETSVPCHGPARVRGPVGADGADGADGRERRGGRADYLAVQ